MRRVGARNLTNIDALLDSHALWPLTEHVGWTAQQVEWLTAGAKQEARDERLKLYMPLSVP
jgi:hypothetical protein